MMLPSSPGALEAIDKIFGDGPKSQKSTRVSDTMTDKKALVLLAPGTEEMEFTISVDVLRRTGVQVTVAGVGSEGLVKCSKEVIIQPEMSLNEAVEKGPYDAVVLPGGGGGSETFSTDTQVGALLKSQEERGGLIAAICAAPLALKAHKIGLGKTITCYPSCKEYLGSDYNISDTNVVIDGNLLTSQGPGTAFDFALTIAKQLVGQERAKEVRGDLLL